MQVRVGAYSVRKECQSRVNCWLCEMVTVEKKKYQVGIR